MNGWSNKWVIEWMGDRMNGWSNEWVIEWMGDRMNGWLNSWDGQTNKQTQQGHCNCNTNSDHIVTDNQLQ